MINRIFTWLLASIATVFLVVFGPFLLVVDFVRKRVQFSRDIKVNGFAFLQARNNTLKYFELVENKLISSDVGGYYYGREPEVFLYEESKWGEQSEGFLKDRRGEILEKLKSSRYQFPNCEIRE